jgi:D,D-heptose 1,7-bisphosphate phosphatase
MSPVAGAAFDPERVVFLDKDGTLIEDLPYNVEPRRIRFALGARDAMRMLGSAGFGVVIVTNQSGVARGYFDESDLVAVEQHLRLELASLGVPLLGFEACPHLPFPDGVNEYAVDCECRKPKPGLILRAARKMGIDPVGRWLVGDTWMDVAAGRAVGCRTILVDRATGDAGHPAAGPDATVSDLRAAAEVILAQHVPPRMPAPAAQWRIE